MPRFVLPKSQFATRWVHSTDALRAHLKERLATIQSRAADKRKEAEEIEREGEQIEQALMLLDQLLPPKASNGTPSLAVVKVDAPAVGKRWSLTRDACVKCGRGQAEGVKHAARGLCQACYWNETHQPVANGVTAAP